jgi:hypothetical protein
MSGHRHFRPTPAGGPWVHDSDREGLRHRNGNPWDRVRMPGRFHVCAAQTALVRTFRTERGWCRTAVLWCACGSVSFPGFSERWVAKNIRRRCFGDDFPVWHRNLIDLGQPARAAGHPSTQREGSDVDAVPGCWRRAGRHGVASGRELVRPAERHRNVQLGLDEARLRRAG